MVQLWASPPGDDVLFEMEFRAAEDFVHKGAGRLLTDKARLNRVAIREDVPVWEAEQALVVNW